MTGALVGCMRGNLPGSLDRNGYFAVGTCGKVLQMSTGAMQSGLAPWLHKGSIAAHHRCRNRCVQPLTAAVATLPLVDVRRSRSPALLAHEQNAGQLLQSIANSSDWRHLQGLYEQHHNIMTTAHVAAIAMQLPRALDNTHQHLADGATTSGLQNLYDEIIPRLEGQLHVMPARLLVGIASAMDVCNTPKTPSWRAAFLSAVAALLAPPTQKPGTISSLFAPIAAQAAPLTATTSATGLQFQASANNSAGATTVSSLTTAGTAALGVCTPLEALSLARHVFVMYSGPGCSEEALSSAVLTDRIITVASAAAAVSIQLRQLPTGSGADADVVQPRLSAVSEAAAFLLCGTGALTRPDAFPARIIMQLLSALCELQVTPQQQWLTACYQGLRVTARPAQMQSAVKLLSQLGWQQSDSASPSISPDISVPRTQNAISQPPTTGGKLTPGRKSRRKSKTPARSGTRGVTAVPQSSSSSPPTAVPSSLIPSAPNSALDGMISLLRDAASSKMLPELKATVFSQLEGCDPGLVLWTAEAFHQLGTPLTGRELAQCVHLAVQAMDADDRGSGLPAWNVLSLIQRCCSQGAAIPPGQLEHLLEYVVSKVDQLQAEQLVDALSAAAAVVARSVPDASALVAKSDASSAARPAAMAEQAGAVRGATLYAVMEALRPVLCSLTSEQAARVAASLTSLRACGIAAALPLPVWLNTYCQATQPALKTLNALQLKQVFTLLARSGHFPSTSYVEDAVEAARGVLASVTAPPPDTRRWAKYNAALVGGDFSAGAAHQANSNSLGDVLAVLELLVLDLGCEPSSLLAANVATELLPALSSQVDQLTPTELSSALRLLAAMRCRPPAGTVQKLLSAMERYLFHLTPSKLSLVAWACAELGAVPRRAFLSRYLEAAAESLSDMRAESLALLGRSFSQLGIVPDASWQRAYRDAVLVRLPEADAETMSILGHGLLHLGLRPDDTWIQGFLAESTYKMPEADAASVARFAHFMASCDCPPPWDWVKGLMERTLAVHPDEYVPPDLLPLVLRSLVRLGWAPDPAWLNELLDRMVDGVDEWQPSSLIITATSIATLQSTSDAQLLHGHRPEEELYVYSSDITYDLLDRIIKAAASKVGDFRSYELRWLLDPLLLLPEYIPPKEAMHILRGALTTTESTSAARRRRPVDSQRSADVCHENIAMGLNNIVSDVWLTSAVML